ncbi:hypothetical protein K493DRAFT_319868 [Basidiobolus meristosporus CBS 931.73]|uniref:I/LWEQ domain-containing protein n=1 Tax=Basidiobolus meristosporus CBS 931.73 TaxID=1314790 RepID=A0A1Y1XJU4_9FUNG|nr:hypothetical protein K493DRAFT_319868 [Basidiobolus meristosporus CBS 931.73]|eukprot:ORX86018.1 hypothetical protein K493DRAFT_319868 [Basidiobolus meristosporus CBS 931.73]
MLMAMHRSVEAHEALEALRSRFNAQHYALRKFFYECSNLKYLTSLIPVPHLQHDPPNFLDAGEDVTPSSASSAAPRQITSTAAQETVPDTGDFWYQQQQEQLALQREQQRQQDLLQQQEQQRQQEILRQQQLAEQRQQELLRQQEQQRQEELQRQQQMEAQLAQQRREYEEQQRQMMERQQQAQEQLARQQMQQHVVGRLQEMEQELLNYRGQHERNQMTLSQYDRRVKALESELSNLNFAQQQRDGNKEALLKALREELAMWKSKYEQLAKLYSQLRQEHLALLGKYKQANVKAGSVAEIMSKLEGLQAELKAKNSELAEKIRDRDRARADLEKFKYGQREGLSKTRRELSYAKSELERLEKSQVEESDTLLSDFNRKKEELEKGISDSQRNIDQMLKRIQEARDELTRVGESREEEVAILQAGMDQSLMALAELQNNSANSESDMQKKLESMKSTHRAKLNKILDAILESCIRKVDDSVFELESEVHLGNQSATPEYVLSMIEKAYIASSEFAINVMKYLSGDDDQTEVISAATGFAEAISQFLSNTKGVSRLAEDNKVEPLIKAAKNSAQVCQKFFRDMESENIANVPDTDRPDLIAESNHNMQASLTSVIELTEALIPKATVVKSGDEDLGDAVEREMRNAARVIEEANARLANLMNKPRNPEITATEYQVHSAILDSAMAMTSAIANLIRRATISQQEIVAEGKGSSSTTAFYKKNNRWTEGLISAAKAVAVATNFLVEAADGVINGTHILEQLIVASNEVAAATAQLVAASRVKANMYSKTQEQLELASKAVTDASKNMVKAVKAIAAKQLEEQDTQLDLANMPKHEFKVKEMEQLMELNNLEIELTYARRKLAEMRRHGYHNEQDVI